MSQEKKDPRQDPAFAEFMDKVLEVKYGKPDPAKIADGMLKANLAALENRILIVGTPYHGKSEVFKRLIAEGYAVEYREVHEKHGMTVIIDEMVDLEKIRMPKLEIGHIDRFRFISSPLVQEPEEPRAKNGALANRKTEAAKAKLPFYLKNRRF
jgi:hypothetical protein